MLQTRNSKNTKIIICVGGRLLAREEAKISVLNRVQRGGNAVWEELRIYKDGIFRLLADVGRWWHQPMRCITSITKSFSTINI